ncbi:MAG: 16S rRNA (cytidine(1402)-2'-O)-methyltransferase [Eggerthellaceae bacterium]
MGSKIGKLIMCPTPLGNLGDMTDRAREAFAQCDVVCCEDTRVTGKLLSILGIEKRLERLDEACVAQKAPQVIARVLAGEVIAYASDAGMPGVSDPGQRLVDVAHDAGVPVEVLPGPTAVATAYVLSGFTAQSFYFGAFFPRKSGDRTRLLEQVSSLDSVLVFYESPQRLVSALEAIRECLPYRRVAVCRELTKVHEEVVRGSLNEVIELFSERAANEGIRGEIVIVIDAPNENEHEAYELQRKSDAASRAQELLQQNTCSKKDMVRILRDEFGLSRNVAYELIHGA